MKSERVVTAFSTALARIAMSCVVVTLAACAGTRAFNDGNTQLAAGNVEVGLAKLEQAVLLDPKNAEYRIALATRRASIITRLTSAAEAAQRDGRLSDAEKAYRQIQSVEPNNLMARQGMDAIVLARRHRQAIDDAEAIFKKGTPADLADALERLRPILSEDPNQKDALNLKARINEARSKEAKPELKLAATFRKPISLEFRDAPLRSVLEVMAKVSGLNFFYDKDIRPDLKTTIFAKNTTIEDAMRLVLVTNQLEMKVLSENSILVYPSTPQKLKDYQTLAVRSFYLTNADVKAVSNSIKTIVKTKDLVTDERLGIIIMRDTPEAIRMAERIVALQDLSDPEVVLEVEILEIKRSRILELGIQWPSQLVLSPLQVNGTPLTLSDLLHLTRTSTQATVDNLTINAHKEDDDANILANPRIRVRNKEKAKVQIGDRVPVITTTSTSTGFVSESVNYLDVGLKLEVEPTIYLDDEVAIKINLEVSNLVREIVSKSGTLSYQIGTRGANTVLRLRNGETQILAGLIDDEDRSTANKIPGLGELPLLSRLFGSEKGDHERSEILLSITPHVVRSLHRPDMLAAEFDSGTETSIGAQTLRLSTVVEATPDAKDAAKTSSPVAPVTPAAQSAAAPAIPGAATTTSASGLAPPVPANVPAVNAAAAATVPAQSASAITGPASVSLTWQGPAQVKVGEQFSVVLRVNSQQALLNMPLLVGFDPQAMQVAQVTEGDFFKQGKGQTSFSQRIDPAQGKVFVAIVRQGTAGSDGGINGTGSLVTVTFKALKPIAAAKVQLLSAAPEPVPAGSVAMPAAHIVRMVP